MLYALDIQTRLRRRPLNTGDRALCPDCGDTMQAKCGAIMPHHWAHTAITGCNGNWGGEMTAWHMNWQERFPEEQREIRISRNGINHRADVCTLNGIVVEFQHSYLSFSDTIEREEFYQNIVWVTDDKNASFINSANCPVFFDDAETQTIKLISSPNSKHFSYEKFVDFISLSDTEKLFDEFVLNAFSSITKKEVFTSKASLLELVSRCQKLTREKQLSRIERERKEREREERGRLRVQKAEAYKKWESQSTAWIKKLSEEDRWRHFEKWEKEQERLAREEEKKKWERQEKERQENEKNRILNSPVANRLRASFKETGYPICDKAILMLLAVTPPDSLPKAKTKQEDKKNKDTPSEKVVFLYQEIIDFDNMPEDMLIKYKEIESIAKDNGWQLTWVNYQMFKIYGEIFDKLRKTIRTEHRCE